MDTLTMQHKATALEALKARRAARPIRINNGDLPAGSPMYFYCKSCGALADTKPEDYLMPPRPLCSECQGLKDLGWLD